MAKVTKEELVARTLAYMLPGVPVEQRRDVLAEEVLADIERRAEKQTA